MLELSYAEGWRRLSAVAQRLGERPPNYHYVRLLLKSLAAQGREPHHDPIVDLMTGRVPWAWLDEAIAGPDDSTAR